MNTKTNSNPSSESFQIDLSEWFFRLLSYWWLYALCLGITIPLAYTYLRYSVFQYSARAVLLIKEAGVSGVTSQQEILFSDAFSGGRKAMDNEIQILKSLPILEKVIDTLDANVSYYQVGQFKTSELYKESPFKLDTFSLTMSNRAVFYFQSRDQNTFFIKKDEEDEGTVHRYNIPFQTELGYFSISYVPGKTFTKNPYMVGIVPIESVAKRYQSKVKVERVGHQMLSSVLELSLVDPVAEKARDVLNALIQIYNDEEIIDENKILRNTLAFIDDRIVRLTQELNVVEGDIQRFKSNNSIITNDAVSSLDFALDEIRSNVKEISGFELKKNLLSSLETLLQSEENDLKLIPSNLFAENPVLGSLVNQYNSMLLQRNQLAVSATDQNPARIAIESQLVDIRASIVQTISNLKNDLQIPIDRIQSNIKKLESNVSAIPSVEKNLVEKQRTQKIKENLFLYLLQKREETALSEAITPANTRVLDWARSSSGPVSPQRKMIFMAATLLGLLIPTIFIVLRNLFQTKIESEDVVKKLTNIPILGRIGFAKNKENIVVKSGDRSAMNEMFRLLRTNLNYLNTKKEKHVLMVTSSVSGEGKSFVAINLGVAVALSNKKVILIGLDLRKPKMSEYLGGNKEQKGISNFLISQCGLDEIIHSHESSPNLDYISSGPIPPNPGELILSDKMEELLNELKKKYDYIIIDTPPVGLVSDSLLLRKYVDNILIVVRHQYTRKVMLKNLEEMYQNKELNTALIVLNGIKQNRSYYGYGGYNYGYGKGSYYTTD